MSSRSTEPIYVVYDGACPFCAHYVRLLRLREAAGELYLVDARAPETSAGVVNQLSAAGYDINLGMALVRGNRIAHGDECIHELALMSTTSSAFNRVNAWIFRSPARAKVLYPVLRVGRNVALRVLGISKIQSGEHR
ncbi:DCC1-like thiol-disulfide oxidoreductase family protein [Microvirga arabica]|nr:DCC1-like thiol-disulfide oxidoreductase family protein [Microvirga arabica]